MIVMVFGTFDLLHKGHINFFKQAKKLGQKMIVVVSQDETVKKIKGMVPHDKIEKRINNIEKIGIADKVIPGYKGDKINVVKKNNPDIIALGYDQNHYINELKKYIKNNKLNTRIVRLKPYKPKIFKTTIIKLKNK